MAPKSAFPSYLGIVIKAAIGVTLLAVIARKFDFRAALDQASSASLLHVAGASAIIFAQHVLAAMRWQAVCTAIGERLAFRLAFVSYLEATFFNQALPSSVGGDAIRVWRISGEGFNIGQAAVSVVLDRAFGLAVLAAMALPGAIALLGHVEGQQAGYTLLICSLAILVSALAGGLLSTIFPSLKRWKIGRTLFDLSEGVKRAMQRPALAIRIIGYSLVGHSAAVLAFQLLALGMHLPFSSQDSFQCLPAILLASALPVSIGGWGVREGATIAVVSGLTLASADQALALSLLLGLSLLLVGLAGGAAWLLDSVIGPGRERDQQKS